MEKAGVPFWTMKMYREQNRPNSQPAGLGADIRLGLCLINFVCQFLCSPEMKLLKGPWLNEVTEEACNLGATLACSCLEQVPTSPGLHEGAEDPT